MKYFGQGIDNYARSSTNFDQFTRCFGTNALNTVNGSFVLAFNLEGLYDSDDKFRSCIPLDGNTTALNFTTGIASIGGTTVGCGVQWARAQIWAQGTWAQLGVFGHTWAHILTEFLSFPL